MTHLVACGASVNGLSRALAAKRATDILTAQCNLLSSSAMDLASNRASTETLMRVAVVNAENQASDAPTKIGVMEQAAISAMSTQLKRLG